MTTGIIDKKKVGYLVIKYVCAVLQCTQTLRYMYNKLDFKLIIRCKVIIRHFIYIIIIYCSR